MGMALGKQQLSLGIHKDSGLSSTFGTIALLFTSDLICVIVIFFYSWILTSFYSSIECSEASVFF